MTAFGPSCPQQAINLDLPSELVSDAVNFILNNVYGIVVPSSEDCEYRQDTTSVRQSDTRLGLTINVVVPAGTQPNAKLPVVAVCVEMWYDIWAIRH